MIIVCTSNAGSEFIRQNINEGLDQTILVNYLMEKHYFSPELINRFDEVVIFKPLGKIELLKIARLQIMKLGERLQKKGINLEVDEAVYNFLVRFGYSPEFGARPMKRLIANNIESLIAQKILKNQIHKGDCLKLTVDPKTKTITIEPCLNKNTPSIST